MARKHIPFPRRLAYLKRGDRFNDNWSEQSRRPRNWEDTYRSRWQHDKVVRSTHGVNCTGSCSWKVYVKDGIITWETQQTDYPSLGKDFPEYEPRGCPRGASFSWYTYSPMRVKYPYVREELLRFWRELRSQNKNPVEAWQSIVSDPAKRSAYQQARGKGGLVRASWSEVSELIAAANIHTITEYGPDRVFGFSPIPAMSQVSYAAGSRFLSLIGGSLLSFYDWYADLPPASPQIWGEQTDVPESADWFNSKYFIIWGTNLPMTRTPDAHFMVEARYHGTKVVGVSPDYAEYIKFADQWLPAQPGTDAALAMAMTHVILKEFYVEKQTPYFVEYAKKYTDLPFLVTLKPHEGAYVTDRFLHASDFDHEVKLGEWKTLVWDRDRGGVAALKGSLGFRWDGSNDWNLKLEDPQGQPVSPELSMLDLADDSVVVKFPYFGADKSSGELIERGVPVKKLVDKDGSPVWVTTVYDLMLAHHGVNRNLPGDYPQDYDDLAPYTPAWQESITGVKREQAIQVAREFADNAEKTRGKSMIALGAGTNHWYHSDLIYRCIINLVTLTGCQGVNGGGWAHYVGQEKVRPLEGWSTIAFGLDWNRPPRQMQGTSFFYFVTDQFRYEELDTKTLGTPLGGRFLNMHPADMNAMAVRLGWMPSYPQLEQNPLHVVKEARSHGAKTNEEVAQFVADKLQSGELKFAVEDPDNPVNFPRVLFVWRSNLLGSSGKGHEYFLEHLLGADGHVLAQENEGWMPQTVKVSDEVPRGKLDLLIDIDFRMTGTALYSDIVLPAATWYEKHDLSSTDMHPFIHPFNPAISSPWETKSDWDTFRTLAETFSKLAEEHLPAQEDLVMTPLGHDTAGEIAQPNGKVQDWRNGETAAVPGKTMPNFTVVRRDYPNIAEQMTTLGPLAQKNIASKGISISGERAYEEVARQNGTLKLPGPGNGRPSLYSAQHVIDAILTMSGATNGRRSVEEFEALSKLTQLEEVKKITKNREDEVMTLHDITAQPRSAMPTPIWSGLEGENTRYSPFAINVQYDVPWHTLTGRQHFYLDHEVMLEFGEGLPLYRPPLNIAPFHPGDADVTGSKARTVTVRYLTPHQKWGIHSMYADNPRMLTLFRGGQTIWMSEQDAKAIGIADNDWVEVYNRNGAIACRAVVTYRIPAGVAMMYHAQDRVIGVPKSEVTQDRGGTHNSVTRIIPKPTHMIGGYGQLSAGFNYYGPTGHQRDALTIIRPLKEVDWLES
ncbi:nitrate reductase subunit alpha [Alicyclobacillus tolerans]|uniref:nitrate reductase subunit alpha n=1 Tax=Alicyclobacillus tolerans TaxID=90970 RepID=UPI001F018FB7|nr:nitrate reductase subunit alpha [Alicyclobacillus tolerans]MCF8567514.1 nitrate reductase subunit alpha [Alicyclobacillus tolerans]